MAFVYYLIISVHVITCLLLIAIVLLQQGKGQDLASAFGGGGSQTAFGPRGSATVLSRATTILAALFMITSLTLSVLKPGRSSVLDQVPETAASPTPAAPAEEAAPPATPTQDEAADTGDAAPAEAPADPPSEQ
jgi:preprotein translocase subunit SecG